MTLVSLSSAGAFGDVPVWTREPAGDGPVPGVVVLFDALGLSQDTRGQVAWLAESGFLAAAPDIYRGGGTLRCMVRTMVDLARGREERSMTAIEAGRQWLLGHPRFSGRVGVIGFCMGGGFAMMLAPRGLYQAASINYGVGSGGVVERLAGACPVVASYGEKDGSLRGQAAKVEAVLATAGVPHDVKEYPGVGHGFMNDHEADPMPGLFVVMDAVGGTHTRYDPQATADARARIVGFFQEHLGGPAS